MLIYSTMIYILNVAIFHGYLRLPKGTGNVQGNWLLFGTWLTLIPLTFHTELTKTKSLPQLSYSVDTHKSTIKYKAQQTVPASKSSEALSPLLQCLMPSKPWWLGGNNIDLGLLGIWKLVSFDRLPESEHLNLVHLSHQCQIVGLQRSTFSDAKI